MTTLPEGSNGAFSKSEPFPGASRTESLEVDTVHDADDLRGRDTYASEEIALQIAGESDEPMDERGQRFPEQTIAADGSFGILDVAPVLTVNAIGNHRGGGRGDGLDRRQVSRMNHHRAEPAKRLEEPLVKTQVVPRLFPEIDDLHVGSRDSLREIRAVGQAHHRRADRDRRATR